MRNGVVMLRWAWAVGLATIFLGTVEGASLTIPSFGQTVPLGTLLDARTITFLPGSSIFHHDFTLPPEGTERKVSLSTGFHVHNLNSTYSKFDRRDYSRALILSILCDQVDVEGSWRYMVEEPKGHSIRYKTELKRKWRRKYHEKIRIKEMFMTNGILAYSMPRFLAQNLSVQDLLAKENENATHFVVGISYGKNIAAVFEDRTTVRRYGLGQRSRARAQRISGNISDTATANNNLGNAENENENEDQIEWTHNLRDENEPKGTHAHTLVRLYTDRPFEADAPPMTPEELEAYFYNFNDNSKENIVPLQYDLMPLSTIVTFLNVSSKVMTDLILKWGMEHYLGDPYIDPLRMFTLYLQFDKISVAHFKALEIMNMLIDLDLERLIPNRRENLEKITALHQKFENSLEEFKGNLREVLTGFRSGRLLHDTFNEGLVDTLRKYEQDPYSPDNFEKILNSEFKELKAAIRLEKLERTVANFYTEVEELLAI